MDTIRTFTTGQGTEGKFHSLPALEEQGIGKISRLPVSIRIVLESVLRNCDGVKVSEEDIKDLANWKWFASWTWFASWKWMYLRSSLSPWFTLCTGFVPCR